MFTGNQNICSLPVLPAIKENNFGVFSFSHVRGNYEIVMNVSVVVSLNFWLQNNRVMEIYLEQLFPNYALSCNLRFSILLLFD